LTPASVFKTKIENFPACLSKLLFLNKVGGQYFFKIFI